MSSALNAAQRMMLIEKFESLTLSEYETLTRQRDELLAALERAKSVIESAGYPVDTSITSAIASVKESE